MARFTWSDRVNEHRGQRLRHLLSCGAMARKTAVLALLTLLTVVGSLLAGSPAQAFPKNACWSGYTPGWVSDEQTYKGVKFRLAHACQWLDKGSYWDFGKVEMRFYKSGNGRDNVGIFKGGKKGKG